MLLTGQPLHAFDCDLVAGGAARSSAARATARRCTTLDDVERTLDSDVVLICDADGPTSIAGIMGGAALRGAADTTTRVLMEAATWNGPNIQRTSTRLGLRTEASGRFEKQLAARAGDGRRRPSPTRLMVELLTGARSSAGRSTSAAGPPPRRTVHLRDARRRGAARRRVPSCPSSAAILERLGFGVRTAPAGSTSPCRTRAAATSPARPT